MTEDEIAAVHEAAHAVYAVFGPWTRLAGPVALNGPGHGAVVMGTEVAAIRSAVAADPAFDLDVPRLDLVRAILAGPVAERSLVESGRALLTEEDLADTSHQDYAIAAEQLARLRTLRPDALRSLEEDVRRRLAEPDVRSAVEQLAAILLDRRTLTAQEATQILEAMRPPAATPRESDARAGTARAWLLGYVLWEGWWAYQFLAAPRPDDEMRTGTAVLLGLILPGVAAALIGLTLLAVRMARRNR